MLVIHCMLLSQFVLDVLVCYVWTRLHICYFLDFPYLTPFSFENFQFLTTDVVFALMVLSCQQRSF
uniref:Putative ovule protein n=1 Tax=Solanum chacoense TaxID=4108 RepID=A0A0V0GI02_SOLCH